MSNIPTSLRIAIGFIIALWIVALTALALGAPREIVVVTAAIGAVGAFVEWTAHRAHEAVALRAEPTGADASALAALQAEGVWHAEKDLDVAIAHAARPAAADRSAPT